MNRTSSNFIDSSPRHYLTPKQHAYLWVKHSLDFLLALAAGLVLLLPMLLLSLLIWLEDRGPVFFTQTRIGHEQTPFTIYKFRTMRVDAPRDLPTHLFDNPRQYITRIGSFMRKFSLDELPQIWNILIGQMSFVGPRPALWNQFDLIDARERYGVHQVRPGLTGWAQINGRDELAIPVKAALDGEYIRGLSLRLDMKCFFGTFPILFTGRGIVEGRTPASEDQE